MSKTNRTADSLPSRRGAARIAAGILLAVLLTGTSASPQDPVTGGEELIGLVRALKQMGDRVHLERLYLEDSVDRRPEQMELVRSGRPLEFGPGFLYHGRAGLDDILISGWIPGICYFTRAPHVWAIGAFRKTFSGPAIFVIEAGEFNRLREKNQAVLEAEIDRDAGILDPYPKVEAGFPLDLVREIWIDEDTAERLDRLADGGDRDPSPRDAALRAVVLRLRGENRLRVLPGLRHTRLEDENFFPAAYEAVGAYFLERGLQKSIPGFRLRGSRPDSQRL